MAIFARSETACARLRECSSCSRLSTLFGIMGCRVCGCVLAAKTRLSAQACPIGIWGKEGEPERVYPTDGLAVCPCCGRVITVKAGQKIPAFCRKFSGG